ncbi:Carboxyl-terminal protease [Acidisarcina polymorpha]|uniref:Carboxyl-terminal protease n=2 Tax=Acidisarcina polymorpha TaxID=2211140 RepID=A0A2Z5GAE5_9BACT|nr:Carboxyl-terminal protease [Acidisarcina polymorpha]
MGKRGGFRRRFQISLRNRAKEDRTMQQSSLNESQRGEILKAITKTVAKKFYDPQSAHEDWDAAVDKHRSEILSASSDEEFEATIAKLLAELKSSHMGFYHSGLARCTCKMALCAVYAAGSTADGPRWIFQDVHEGGPAAGAGIRSGDALIAVEGRSFRPPDHPLFAMGSTVTIEVSTLDGRRRTHRVSIPFVKVKRNQLPKVEPNPLVSARRVAESTGYVRIASYPGAIGIDVANHISHALQNLGPIDRLIVDLRGNSGGGIGVLRVMSLLTPDKLVVGTFSNGVLKSTQEIPNGSFVFNEIPVTKRGLIPLAFRFFTRLLTHKLIGKKMPITVVTEGLGDQLFHEKVVFLVDRHTASANEMLIAFAREHKLAKIVGEPTPGRVLGGNKFKLPYGYWLALPVGSYKTRGGDFIEGRPMPPDVEVPFDAREAQKGRDTQLDMALQVVRQL